MVTFVTIVHVVLCVFMMFVILLQPGKDAGMGAALGGGAATSAFGGRGAVTFLSKVTAVCAALFFMTSLGLSFVGVKTSVAAGIEPPAPAAQRPAGDAIPVSPDGSGAAAGGALDDAVPAGSPQSTPAPSEASKPPARAAPPKRVPASKIPAGSRKLPDPQN